MHGAEQIMWAIASLLACWSLAVFLRVFDERRFFRKHPASPVPRVGAKWAWRVALAAFIAAIGTGWLAVWFARAVPSGRDTTIGIFHVAGGASALFAVSCGFMWIIGDRSRGRRRCGRCWYDMAAVPGRRCPECGHEPKAEQGLFRSRRARWQLASAIVLLAAGGAMLTLAARSTGPGLMQSTPTWLIVRAWRFVPDEWFHGEDGSMADRFEYMSHDPDTLAVGERLVGVLAQHRTARSKEEMWRAAGNLFFGMLNNSGHNEPMIDELDYSYPRETDLNALAASVLRDRIDALSVHIGDPNRAGDISGYWASYYTNAWIASRLVEEGRLPPSSGWRYEYWGHPDAEQIVRAEVLRTADATLPEGFHTLIQHPRPSVRDEYLALMMTMGQYGTVVSNAETLLTSDTDIGYWMARSDLLLAVHAATDVERAALFDMLIGWVESGTSDQAKSAVRFAHQLMRRGEILDLPNDPNLDRVREAMLGVATDTTDPRVDGFNNPIRGWFIDALFDWKFPGEIAFPIARDWLLEDSEEHWLSLYWYEDPSYDQSAWIEHLAPLADHPAPSLRYLCAVTAPMHAESLDNERIDRILDKLSYDYDERVNGMAWDRKTERNEARLARDPEQAEEPAAN